MTRRFSTGFLAPIRWGITEGYLIEEIAEGLGLDLAVVVAAVLEIAATSSVSITDEAVTLRARDPSPVRDHRRDWAYRNWARSRRAATAALDHTSTAPGRMAMRSAR